MQDTTIDGIQDRPVGSSCEPYSVNFTERLRCHQSFVARIVSGQRRIDVPELVIIARALDVPAEHFFDAVIKAVPPGERI